MKKTWRISIFLAGVLSSCTKEECTDYKGYPPEVGKIILDKCATAGCHNNVSKKAAAGLSLETWQEMFEGSRYGNTAIIPYRVDLSFLTYFINTYNDLGPAILPVMPVGQSALSREEVMAVQDWINKGASANNGLIPWTNFNGTKMFVVNQGCDNVYIMDAETGLVMRAVNIGASPAVESPHYIEISPDERFFYVCFYAGNVFQKFSTRAGEFVGEVNIGAGQWSAFEITPDGKFAFVTDWRADGAIAVVDLENMAMPVKYQGTGLLTYPHGTGMKGNYLYVTTQPGNFIYKIDVSDIYNPDIKQLSILPGLDAHEIHFSQDGSEYVISCVGTNEVRFFNSSDDSFIVSVATGKKPEEPHYGGDYLFVVCPNDDVTFPGKRGCISIIDAKTHTFIKNIHTGWEPHGIIPDEEGGKVWVLHRNVGGDGPPPHHSSKCSGRNGYMTAIDLNTLELIPNLKPELSVDPYFGAIMGHHH